MKKSELKELIKTSLLEEEYLEDDPTAAQALEDAENVEEAEVDSIAEADAIVEAWNSKKKLTEEMHGGYIELMEMNPKFDEGLEMLLEVWNEWKSGEMTEPEMIEEAKHDVLAYLSSMMS